MKYLLFNYCLLCLCLASFACSQKKLDKTNTNSTKSIAESPIFYTSHEPKKKDAPFSDVVKVGDLYFLSGQIGLDHSSRTLVEGGIQAETLQTLENIKAVLLQHDLSMKDVVKVLVILDDIEDFGEMNKIYTTYFPQKPARTTFAAEALARGAKIEIEVIALKSGLQK